MCPVQVRSHSLSLPELRDSRSASPVGDLCPQVSALSPGLCCVPRPLLCPQVVGPAKHVIIFSTEYLLWRSTWNVSISSIVRNIREHKRVEHKCNTEVSEAQEFLINKFNQLEAVLAFSDVTLVFKDCNSCCQSYRVGFSGTPCTG